MLPEEHSAEFEIRQAAARIRREYEQRLASADAEEAKRLRRRMNNKIRCERVKIKVKHSFAFGRVIR
jgi:hypothetical protein